MSLFLEGRVHVAIYVLSLKFNCACLVVELVYLPPQESEGSFLVLREFEWEHPFSVKYPVLSGKYCGSINILIEINGIIEELESRQVWVDVGLGDLNDSVLFRRCIGSANLPEVRERRFYAIDDINYLLLVYLHKHAQLSVFHHSEC